MANKSKALKWWESVDPKIKTQWHAQRRKDKYMFHIPLSEREIMELFEKHLAS